MFEVKNNETDRHSILKENTSNLLLNLMQPAINKGRFMKVYSNMGGQLQNLSGQKSAVYILYGVIKGMNKNFIQFKKFLGIYIKYL